MDKLFRIIEITEEFVDDILTRSYDAHFHDFEELIIVTEGSLEHYIDFQVETINAPAACYVSMGKMHKLIPNKDLRGWLINYKTEFLPESSLNFYSHFFTSTTIQLSTGCCIERFTKLCEIIYTEYKQEFSDLSTLRHLATGLISMADAERKRSIPVEAPAKASQVNTFNNFLKILEENFRLDKGVSFYAEKMNMSERNLNLICRNNFQKSVSEIIETRKLIEAKHFLLYTDKSVSEIGYELGYNEKSYFTRVFHARMDITPSRYREMSRNLLS
jgi:AraC family transcriptional regulator, transcriptional activator of pobA